MSTATARANESGSLRPQIVGGPRLRPRYTVRTRPDTIVACQSGRMIPAFDVENFSERSIECLDRASHLCAFGGHGDFAPALRVTGAEPVEGGLIDSSIFGAIGPSMSVLRPRLLRPSGAGSGAATAAAAPLGPEHRALTCQRKVRASQMRKRKAAIGRSS
jgi:hypothetical protein